ncbi:protein-disulfide reductase DsbD domain-containing protein [Pararhodobacter marinus]|uniref:protein-disulfide reductase DsbD domain-containing protein n=1 Tax=Pararhodobacter marinus TaxID=2184063 RepID=UPI00351262EE
MTSHRPTLGAALRTALAAIALVTAPLAAPAQSRGAPVVEAEILPGWATDRGTHMAALHLRLSPGWHTYWRVPGDAGIAPRFDWSRSQNVASIRPIWPRPEVFDQNGYRSYGYEDELILPIEITPADPARPVALMGQMALGVCNETCVPADVSVAQVIRGAGGQDPRIQAALDSAARPGSRAGLGAATCRLVPDANGAELTLRAPFPPQGGAEHVIVELPGSAYRVIRRDTRRDGAELVAETQLRAPRRGEAAAIDRSTVIFTVLSDTGMVWGQGCTGG